MAKLPPQDDEARARGYRERADELRAVAAKFVNSSARKDLLDLARDWEHMADLVERRMQMRLRASAAAKTHAIKPDSER